MISSEKDIEKLKQSVKIKVINELFFVGVSKNEVCRNGNKPIADQFNFNYKDLVFFKTFYDFQHSNRTAEIKITHVNLEEIEDATVRCY